jgi:hypothetical protein
MFPGETFACRLAPWFASGLRSTGINPHFWGDHRIAISGIVEKGQTARLCTSGDLLSRRYPKAIFGFDF